MLNETAIRWATRESLLREKYEKSDDADTLGKLADLLADHALYADKHVKLHPMQQSMRTAVQNKLAAFEIPPSDQANAYPMPLDNEGLAVASGKLTPVAVESTPDGVGLVLSQIVLQKTREAVDTTDLDNVPEWLSRYDELVGVQLKPVPLFHVMWVPHERDFVEFRLDCTLGTGTRNAFTVHSHLRRFCADLLDINFEEAYDLFPAIISLYGDIDVGRATEISFSTPTHGLHNERMLRRDQGDSRTQAYHLAGKGGVGDDISVFHIAVEWYAELGFKTPYPISIELRGSGPTGKGLGNNPQVNAALLEGCLTSEDFESLIEILSSHASLENMDVI